MMVDSMTKKMAADYLRLVMKSGKYQIVDDPNAVLKTALEKDAAKEKRAATKKKKKEKGPTDKNPGERERHLGADGENHDFVQGVNEAPV